MSFSFAYHRKIGIAEGLDELFGAPVGFLKDIPHLLLRDKKIIEPFSDDVFVTKAHADLAGHAAASAVSAMIGTVMRICSLVRVEAAGYYLRVKSGYMREFL